MFSLLNGIKVVDLTTIVLGPYATQFLGDFGADIIKVENISGDLFRTVRPGRSSEMGAGFINCNRNKRSIALDLKTPEGKTVLSKLVKEADVVVHNMRTSTATRLGIDYETLKQINDKIVYCFAPGYGLSSIGECNTILIIRGQCHETKKTYLLYTRAKVTYLG